MPQTMQRVATGSYRDYGSINGCILFSADVLSGNEPLKVKAKVPAVVEVDQITHGSNAITVDAYCDGHGDDLSASHMTVSLECITSLIGDVDHTNNELSFSLDIVCKDFEPCKCDLVEIEFSEHSRKAILMRPLKHHHINEVCVTRADGRTGVLEDTIYFTLDSLKLPFGMCLNQMMLSM